MKNIFIVFCILLFVACSKDEIIKFESDSAIRFLGNAEVNRTFLFQDMDCITDTVWLEVQTSGDVSERERRFVIEQLYEYPELTYIKDEHGNIQDSVIDAKVGVHYEPFNEGETFNHLKIEGGYVSTKVPIILIRHNDIRSKAYRLAVKLVANEEFNADFTEGMLVRKIFFTDLPIKPNNWDSTATLVSLWGEYSEVKFRFILSIVKQEIDEKWISTISYPALTYWQNKLNAALQEYNSTNEEPLKDENGKYISFP